MFVKRMKDEGGQVIVITLLSMTVLMGFLALAVDVGTLFNARRRMQTAADAAATAATLSYYYSGSTATAATAGGTAAANNGVTAGSNNSVSANATCADLTQNCVEILFGANIKNAYHNVNGYVEAIVSQPNPAPFASVFGFGAINVSAKAVGGVIPATPCGILTKNVADALYTKGSDTITGPNCGIQVNSSDPSAFCNHDNGTTLDVAYISIVGGSGCKTPSGVPVYTNQQAAQDPYANLPDAGSYCNSNNTNYYSTGATLSSGSGLKSTTVTIPSNAAAYANTSFTISCFNSGSAASPSTPGSGSPITLGSGLTLGQNADQGNIFVFLNGASIGNGSTVTVYGALDNEDGTFSQNTNSTFSIYATGSDNNSLDKTFTYNSLAFIQPTGNTTATCPNYPNGGNAPSIPSGMGCLQLQFGSNSSNLEGELYAPNSMLFMHDQGGGTQAAGFVVGMMYANSSITLTDNYNHANPLSTPNSQVALVE